MIEYVPEFILRPPRVSDAPSAWGGIESILAAVVKRFCANTKLALEFGVEHGYSTVAISNFFDHVIGVDHFCGDIHTGKHESIYQETVERLQQYPNIELVNKSWQEWTKKNDSKRFDLIHIDIEHTYEQTFGCGMWATAHSPVVIFHDIQSFPDVLHAVTDIAEQRERTFYAYHDNLGGLGILA